MKEFTNLDYQHKKLINAIDNLEDKKQILSAIELAKKSHKGQKRDEGQDYIIHPLRIANCLIFELSIKDTELLIAAILHDVVEDSKTTINEIKSDFGEKVAELVGKLTRDKRKETKQEKFQKLMKESKEARLLKALDWLDNLRSFPFRTLKDKRFFRHVKEASTMYLPMAEGVNSYIASEMRKIIKILPMPQNSE